MPIAQLYERLGVSAEKLQNFCEEKPIDELAFFGSVLRADFREDSDIDILVVLDTDCQIGLLEFFSLEEQFSELFQRDVDLLERGPIEKDYNWIRRREILNTVQVIYESLCYRSSKLNHAVISLSFELASKLSKSIVGASRFYISSRCFNSA
ncbi:nucleotidyltransferase domain-containing protein [cf. Phormidesmis sp. LEGE 11477]|nr:nucleotidyltransferase domain-containing protein [cf. Phormidesmis sp. LEGE 11477]